MADDEEPEKTADGGFARDTEITESDPNADSRHGLAGGMGVSSERTGTVRGADGEVTYSAEPSGSIPDADPPPEQNAEGEEVKPDQPPVKDHRSRLHGDVTRPRSGE